MAGEEDLIKIVMEKLIEARNTKDWVMAMQKRAEAVKLIKDNLSVVRFVNVAQLNQKLRAMGFAASEVQKIIRGVSVAQKVVAAGGAVAEVETGAVTFITIAGVELTAIEATIVAGVIVAVLLGCIAVGYVIAKVFFSPNDDMVRNTVYECAYPYKFKSQFMGVVH